jgi:hypothetical protein
MSCIRCGYCCQNIIVPYVNSPGSLEWIKARGLKILLTREQVVYVEVPHKCKHLEYLEYGRFVCLLQKDKPETCKDYPRGMIDDFGEDAFKLMGERCGYKNSGEPSTET